MSATPPAIPPLDGVLGTTLIGGVLGTFLFGIGTLQTYNYYRRYPTDSRTMKILIAAIWVIELGHTISLWHALYSMTVTYYGQLPHLFDPPHSLEMTVLFSAMINVVVQTFFAYRIRTLSGQWPIPIICSLLTAARFTFNMIMMIAFWRSSSGFVILHTSMHWAMVGVSTLGPAVDILIAASLCFYLWRIRTSGSHFKQTRNAVDTLILWSLETTTITSATGIMQLIFFLSRSDLVWIVFFLIQPKLFSNSILAHLNGRDRFRIGNTVNNLSDNYSGRMPQTDHSLVIRMDAMTEVRRDTDSFPKDKVR
ncbi:hypothetical protein B0H12DRAFT_1138668 [Mycena haematopus]|nr:hypothetical protein B0H12DRAFT_1138668 [Mycena haematopus]